MFLNYTVNKHVMITIRFNDQVIYDKKWLLIYAFLIK